MKVKSKYWDYINSDDYDGYLHGNDIPSDLKALQDDFQEVKYPSTVDVKKRLTERFKKFKQEKQ